MPRAAFVFAALLLLLPAPAALAKEESKIQIRLLAPGPGAGNGNGLGNGAVRGDVRTHLQGDRVILALRVRGLEPETEYALICLDDELAEESSVLVRFETGGNGSANVKQDLSKTDDPGAPPDPRGKLLRVVDGDDQEILGGWLYGEPEDDGPKTKIKERTQLAPDPVSDPSGRVEATYRTLPNGRSRLTVKARDLPAGSYELWVDGIEVATFSPNSGGNAKLDFRSRMNPGKGPKKVKPHRKKQLLDFDPRRKWIEVQLEDGTPMFAGPMIAQIRGLNVCGASSESSALTGPTGSGSVLLEVEADCETALDVSVMDVPAGSYDLYVDGALVASFDAADEGGTVTGGVRFDPTPDAAGELLLDFAVDTGLPVEVFDAGANPAMDTPVLSGALP